LLRQWRSNIACFQLENHNFELEKARYLYYMRYHRTGSEARVLLGPRWSTNTAQENLCKFGCTSLFVQPSAQPFLCSLCAINTVQHVILGNIGDFLDALPESERQRSARDLSIVRAVSRLTVSLQYGLFTTVIHDGWHESFGIYGLITASLERNALKR
jgi:hypothetical protein